MTRPPNRLKDNYDFCRDVRRTVAYILVDDSFDVLNPTLVWPVDDSGTWDVEEATEDAVESRARYINLNKFLKKCVV
jgi:hypothetical protein